MKYLIATALIASFPLPASSADAGVQVQPPVAPVAHAPHSWTGAYVGLNAGYGRGKFKGTEQDFELPELSGSDIRTAHGFIGGGQAGYNRQAGSFVYGLETDIQYSPIGVRIREEDEEGVYEANAGVKWLGTTRARVGVVPTERLLTYVTGGLAYGQMEVRLKGGDLDLNVSKKKLGWTAGVGAEYAIDDQWSLKTEYLYTDLGTMTIKDDAVSRAQGELKPHLVRIGLNYKF